MATGTEVWLRPRLRGRACPSNEEWEVGTVVTMLNIGSNDKTIPGFVNVDIEPLGDVCADVRFGLPFASGSVEGVFSEHFIEHIELPYGVAFLRECRRVLRPGGRVRVATPDLAFAIHRYTSGTWREGDMFADGSWDFVQTGAEQFNIAMREWGHQWIYDEEELRRAGHMAGLDCVGRYEMGESDHPSFVGLEYRPGSTLILEFEKRRPPVRTDEPLVSVLIPAYRATFLDDALRSARDQTWRNLEILVGDDCPDESVHDVVAPHLAQDERIRYHRNPPDSGGARANHQGLVDRATGEYLKFLSDDDLLAPRCVERMARCLNARPDVTLVTSHRARVDADGQPLPDDGATLRRVADDSVVEGVSAVDFMLQTGVNWIGEPTTAMFRAADLDRREPDIFSYLGRPAVANGDVTLWTQLLGRGDLVYLVESLSEFRQHDAQGSADPEWRRGKALAGWDRIRHDAKRMGLIRPMKARLDVRPLDVRPWWTGPTMDVLRTAEGALDAGEIDAALAALVEACRASGDDVAVRVMYGELLVASGAIGEGLEVLQATALANQSSISAVQALARAARAIGKDDDADTLDSVAASLLGPSSARAR